MKKINPVWHTKDPFLIKLRGSDHLEMCFWNSSWKKKSLHSDTHQRGLVRFVLEVVFHWLKIWLTQAKTWQERLEVVNTWRYFCARHLRYKPCIVERHRQKKTGLCKYSIKWVFFKGTELPCSGIFQSFSAVLVFSEFTRTTSICIFFLKSCNSEVAGMIWSYLGIKIQSISWIFYAHYWSCHKNLNRAKLFKGKFPVIHELNYL